MELRFRGCSRDGFLLYAEDSSGTEYIAVGLLSGQILVEYRDVGGSINEVSVTFLLMLSSLLAMSALFM